MLKLELFGSCRDTSTSALLDGVRFFSAVLVVIFHMGYDFIPGYQAVMVFFVLSGFFISSSVLRSMRETVWSWKKYIIDRVVRLWVVLIPSFLLSFIIIFINLYWFGGNAVYEKSINILFLIDNLFFLQFLSGDIFSYNLPLWSLSYEFWFYMLFPLLACLFYYRKWKSRIFVFSVSCFGLFFAFDILPYFFIWLLGVFPAIFAVYRKEKFSRINFLFAILFFVFAINLMYVCTGTNHPREGGGQFVFDIITTFFTAYLIFSLRSVSGYLKISTNVEKMLRWLGSFSYSIYVLHYPLVQLLLNVKIFYFKKGIVSSVIFVIFGLILVLLYCYFVSLFTERKTGYLKSFVYNKLGVF